MLPLQLVAKLIANPAPGAAVPPILPPQDGFLMLEQAKFADSFAGDLSLEQAEFMAASQDPWGVNALSGEVTAASWKTKPSWYMVATDDKMIPPDAQRGMSKRWRHCRRGPWLPRGVRFPAEGRRQLHREGSAGHDELIA